MSNIKLINASGQSTVYENIDTLKMTDEDNHYVFFDISYTQYNISYNLATESHSSSSDTTVNSNGTFTTTISYDSGYTKDSIVVTMGGTDISSTAVSGNIITVSNPTGDLLITVTTKEQTSYLVAFETVRHGEDYYVYDGTTTSAPLLGTVSSYTEYTTFPVSSGYALCVESNNMYPYSSGSSYTGGVSVFKLITDYQVLLKVNDDGTAIINFSTTGGSN